MLHRRGALADNSSQGLAFGAFGATIEEWTRVGASTTVPISWIGRCIPYEIERKVKEILRLEQGQLLELVEIPPGRFQMGSTLGLPPELPVHTVRILQPVRLGKFPVTQGQWKAVMGPNPSAFLGCDELPVDSVSWDAASEFCKKLAMASGRQVRLPSEAVWEYACRSGATSDFFFGSDERKLRDFAWYDQNSGSQTHAVGLKKPNEWGLYDMIGNVWEWCEDVWHGDYEGAPDDGTPWLDSYTEQPRRCLRGGAWNFDAFRCRSAYRSREWKQHATDHFGFRVMVCD